MVKIINDIIKNSFVNVLKLYQYLISPLLGSRCRYHPTCSSYAIAAISKHGGFQGFWLSIKRLLRCHPFHPGGYDPVP